MGGATCKDDGTGVKICECAPGYEGVMNDVLGYEVLYKVIPSQDMIICKTIYSQVCTLKIVYPGDSCANGELCTGNSTCTNNKCACTSPKYVAMDEYSLKGLCVTGDK